MAFTPPKLRYLFAIRYSDGSEYRQSPYDRSKYHPLTKSCFYEAAYEQDLNHLVKLDERGQQIMRSDMTHIWLHDNGRILGMVDLIDCTLHTDKHTIPPPVWPLHDIRPIYFRRVTVDFTGDEAGLLVGSYFIGWQALDEQGKSHQRSLEIT